MTVHTDFTYGTGMSVVVVIVPKGKKGGCAVFCSRVFLTNEWKGCVMIWKVFGVCCAVCGVQLQVQGFNGVQPAQTCSCLDPTS